MRILVLCGDSFHPGQAARAGLEVLANSGDNFEFDIQDDATGWSPESLADYPLVLLTKTNHTSATNETPWLTPAIEEAFLEYVKQGHGLLAVHSGAAGYANSHTLRKLLGGMFTQHPAQCDVSVDPYPDQPLSADVAPFSVFDEHYHMDTEPGNALFLDTRSEHGVQPGGWTRLEGEGRVCVLTPGHNPEVWTHPNYQTLLKRAILWTSQTTNS